jgi:hypothetical protein
VRGTLEQVFLFRMVGAFRWLFHLGGTVEQGWGSTVLALGQQAALRDVPLLYHTKRKPSSTCLQSAFRSVSYTHLTLPTID